MKRVAFDGQPVHLVVGDLPTGWVVGLVQLRPDGQTATSPDNVGAYLGSTAIGALADMLVALRLGPTPSARHLMSYGRWQQTPVTVERSKAGRYRVLKEPRGERPAPPDPSLPLQDRLLLLLLQAGPDARPPARELAPQAKLRGTSIWTVQGGA